MRTRKTNNRKRFYLQYLNGRQHNVQRDASRTGQDQLNITHKGRYTSGADFGNGGTEIVKYNPKNGYAYSVNGDKEALDIIDVKHPGKDGAINLVKRIYLQDNGIEVGDLTSVTVHPSGIM